MRQLQYITIMFFSQTSIYVARALTVSSIFFLKVFSQAKTTVVHLKLSNAQVACAVDLPTVGSSPSRILQAHHFLE